MKKIKHLFFLFTILISGFGCSDNNTPDTPDQSSSEWLIPRDDVFNGGPGKDGIPSIDDPSFISKEETDARAIVREDDLVIGIKVGNEIRAYPHPIMDWHEIVNDKIGDLAIAVTYCPLTGTAIGWNRTIDGAETTFGVSGLLYNTNLMPYDRRTDSNWSQMLLRAVNGSSISTEIETYPLLETTWKEWKVMFPDAQILSFNTGFSRPYSNYPYGDYRTNNDLLLFPVTNDDTRIPRKERGLGVTVEDQTKFYRFGMFTSSNVVTLNDNLNGRDIIVVGSQERNFLLAYNREIVPGITLDFEPLNNEGATVMIDNNGDRWNIFGEALEGPYTGQRLQATNSYIGMWFAWATFHPQIEIAN